MTEQLVMASVPELPKNTEGSLLVDERHEPQLDAELAKSLEVAIGSYPEVYREMKIDPDRAEVIKGAWHRGENPDLSSTHLDIDMLKERLQSLKRWKQEVLLTHEGVDDDIILAYRWKINEEIANTYMMIASAKGDQRSFRRWNKFIYGDVEDDVFRACIDKFASDAEALLAVDTASEVVKQASKKVLEISSGLRGDKRTLEPSPEVFAAVREDHMREKGYYALLLAGVEVPASGKIDHNQGLPILEHVVRHNLKSPYRLRHSADKTWSVVHSQGGIEHPSEYSLPVERFIGLGLGHEIGSHLLERVNGQRSPLGLAAIGLDRYESGNEGRAIIREQVVYDSFDVFAKIPRWREVLRRYVAIGYANGTNGGVEEHDSASTYEFVNAIDMMYQARLTPGEDGQVIAQKARAKTDTLLLRVLKGTDGLGGAYLKDSVYAKGNVAYWRQAEHYGPSVISDGDLAKSDLTNLRHIALLQKYGVIPAGE